MGLSNCCGAELADGYTYNGIGICSDCKEYCEEENLQIKNKNMNKFKLGWRHCQPTFIDKLNRFFGIYQ
jgi:hypothetical protein